MAAQAVFRFCSSTLWRGRGSQSPLSEVPSRTGMGYHLETGPRIKTFRKDPKPALGGKLPARVNKPSEAPARGFVQPWNANNPE